MKRAAPAEAGAVGQSYGIAVVPEIFGGQVEIIRPGNSVPTGINPDL